jgi:hypothetical protein
MRFVYRLDTLLAFLLLSLFVCGQSGRSDPFILTIEKTKRGIVPVLCGRFDERGQFVMQIIEGTGFFIDRQGHFVTAAHVIRGLKIIAPQQPVPCVPAIDIPMDGWNREAPSFQTRWFKFVEEDCVIDDALDLAVCKSPYLVPFKIYPLVLSDTKPPDGVPVAFTGFPLGNTEPLSSRCNIATYRAAIDTDGSRELVLDKGTWPGASGSPVYGEDGRILGILLQRGLGDGVGIAIARPAHFIVMFLRSKGITVTTSVDNKKNRKQ